MTASMVDPPNKYPVDASRSILQYSNLKADEEKLLSYIQINTVDRVSIDSKQVKQLLVYPGCISFLSPLLKLS